jgi:hypothetical protein
MKPFLIAYTEAGSIHRARVSGHDARHARRRFYRRGICVLSVSSCKSYPNTAKP